MLKVRPALILSKHTVLEHSCKAQPDASAERASQTQRQGGEFRDHGNGARQQWILCGTRPEPHKAEASVLSMEKLNITSEID